MNKYLKRFFVGLFINALIFIPVLLIIAPGMEPWRTRYIVLVLVAMAYPQGRIALELFKKPEDET